MRLRRQLQGFVRRGLEKHFITNLKAAGHALLPQL
jgi:hypothetical protein